MRKQKKIKTQLPTTQLKIELFTTCTTEAPLVYFFQSPAPAKFLLLIPLACLHNFTLKYPSLKQYTGLACF